MSSIALSAHLKSQLIKKSHLMQPEVERIFVNTLFGSILHSL